MSLRLGLCLAMLMVLGMDSMVAQAQDSFRFNQPIPVTIRRTNNSVVQTFLAAIDGTNVTVVTPQGRQLEYPNNTVRSVRSNDGSFFYAPAKDNIADIVQKLNQMQGGNGGQPGIPGQPGAIPGQPGAATTTPFTVSGANPAGGHSQPPQNNPGTNQAASTNAAMAQMMAHSQAMAHNQNNNNTPATLPGSSHYQAPTPHSQTPHSQTPYSGPSNPPGAHSAGMPMNGHSQSPSMPPGMPMPGMPGMGAHSQSPSMPSTNTMPGMNTGPQSQMQMEYECSKCKYRFTSPVEIKAGHKCAKCGVIWGQVQDQNGNVTSSNPAARLGGGVGVVVMVIGIIAAIVRKANASA